MIKQARNISFLQAVGRRLRQLREECGLSQEKVQFKTGIYTVFLETGKRNITVSTLIDLCKVYDVTLEQFFAGMEFYEGQPLPSVTETTDAAEASEPTAAAPEPDNEDNEPIADESI